MIYFSTVATFSEGEDPVLVVWQPASGFFCVQSIANLIGVSETPTKMQDKYGITQWKNTYLNNTKTLLGGLTPDNAVLLPITCNGKYKAFHFSLHHDGRIAVQMVNLDSGTEHQIRPFVLDRGEGNTFITVTSKAMYFPCSHVIAALESSINYPVEYRDSFNGNWFFKSLSNFISIGILTDVKTGGHDNLFVCLPSGEYLLKFDSYYYTLLLDDRSVLDGQSFCGVLQEHFYAYLHKLVEWLDGASAGDCVYCSFDVSDQYCQGLIFTLAQDDQVEIQSISELHHSGSIWPSKFEKSIDHQYITNTGMAPVTMTRLGLIQALKDSVANGCVVCLTTKDIPQLFH